MTSRIEQERDRLIAWIERHQLPVGTRMDREMTADALLADFITPLLAELAVLRSQDRGAREMREPQPKVADFRQLSDDERRNRAAALAQAYRDERAAVWPAGCLKPNSCARHRGCMYAQSAEQCRHYGLDLTEAVALAEQEKGR